MFIAEVLLLRRKEPVSIIDSRRATVAVALTAGIALTLSGCSSGTEPTTAPDATTATATPRTTTAATTAAATPQPSTYTLEQSNNREYRALVTTADSRSLRLAWETIRAQFLAAGEPGGYFVRFDCEISDEPGAATNRLANAKVAVGALGAAQTGLREGKSEFVMNPGAPCGDDDGFHATFDRTAPLTEQTVTDVCREHIEDQYTVEQLPVELRDVTATEASDGKWSVAGEAVGASRYGGDTAVMEFRCSVWKTSTGTLMRDLPVWSTTSPK
jgi:hypothetical protein